MGKLREFVKEDKIENFPKTKEEIKQIYCFASEIDKKIYDAMMCMSYIIRFKVHRRDNTKSSDASSTSEIHKSEKISLRLVQQDFFKDEYKRLIKGEEIKDR